MAEISVTGWIAQGGGKLYHAPEGDFILFDLIEEKSNSDGLENELGTNPAWFHCSFEIIVGDSKNVGFVPQGCTIDGVNWGGYARIIKNDCESQKFPKNPCIRSDQVVGFIKEGKKVKVKGQELLLKEKNGNLTRNVMVREIDFKTIGDTEIPMILKVPYTSNFYFVRRK